MCPRCFAGLAVSANLQGGAWPCYVERGRCACRCSATSAVVHPSEVIQPCHRVATFLTYRSPTSR